LAGLVLDTNILLKDPKILNISAEKIIIPIDVIHELDAHKNDHGEVGANARASIRFLDTYSELSDITQESEEVHITVGVWTPTLSRLLKSNKLPDSPDSRILCTALANKSILVSDDLAVRIKARVLGLEVRSSEFFDPNSLTDDVYGGMIDIQVDGNKIDELHSKGACTLEEELHPNQYVLLTSNINVKHSAIGRMKNGRVLKISEYGEAFGLKPRNVGQKAALDMLMDPDVVLASMMGHSGCGKTILALSAAFEQVLERSLYNKVILMKSLPTVGQSLGYLPGTEMEKLAPYLNSYLDNIAQLFPSKNQPPDAILQLLISGGSLEVAPPTYVRGRSITNTIIVVDEVQNMSKHEIKTIATRLGEGSKLIVLGDIKQIDTNLDYLNNGLTCLVEAFKDEPCAAHVTLTKGERSLFADLAAEKL
jgi:PhoH-like ATPase